MVSQDGSQRLRDRRAIITGGSSGIGEATARTFAAEGARIVVVGRRPEALARVVDGIGTVRAHAVVANVTDADDVERWASEAWDWLGGCDVLVNSAGLARPAPLATLSAASWQEILDVNLSGTFYASREIGLRMFAGDGGTIVNLGSELSFLGMSTNVAYCAAKAGIVGLTRGLAAELCPKVTVNAICPGPVDTPMLRGAFEAYLELYATADTDAVQGATEHRIPLGRLATAEEMARSILYLAADASYATGAMLALDGGSTALIHS